MTFVNSISGDENNFLHPSQERKMTFVNFSLSGDEKLLLCTPSQERKMTLVNSISGDENYSCEFHLRRVKCSL
jgi:hypothetical protein